MIEITGLWLKETKDGKKYFSGTLGGASVLIFKNEKKGAPNHPDYKMYLAENKPKQQQQGQQRQQSAPVKNYAPKATQQAEPSFNSDDDIPF